MTGKPYFPTTRDLPPSQFQELLDGILNIIYPERCLICASPIARRRDCGVCAECWRKTAELRIKPPRCSSCGLPFHNFQDDSEHLCGECILHPPPYSGARSFGYYSAELSTLIHGLKFHGRRNLTGLLGPLLADVFVENWDRECFDIVTPVPLHPKRQRERGYNQSELLARSLSQRIAISCYPCLRRIRPTAPQVGLTDIQRRENVRKAFLCRNPGFVRGKRILLVDDVMTTGATVSSAAQALLDGGALRVSILTLARA
jgi:ComF family protein